MIRTEADRTAFLEDVEVYGREYAEAKHGVESSNTVKVGVIVYDITSSMAHDVASVSDYSIR